jgi:hypothetical protein
VQSQDGKLRSDKRDSHSRGKGRVVSMRAWRTKKRLQSFRGSRSWVEYLLALVNGAFLLAALVSALLSCIPFAWQAQSIIFTSFFATVGSVLSLVLHVMRDRFALRALSVYVLCMTLSFVVALVKLA